MQNSGNNLLLFFKPLPWFADKLQIPASAKQQITVRRNSVTIGDKVFPPKCAEVTEHRRKKTLAGWFIGRIILNRSADKLFCHKLSEFYSNFERLMAYPDFQTSWKSKLFEQVWKLRPQKWNCHRKGKAFSVGFQWAKHVQNFILTLKS